MRLFSFLTVLGLALSVALSLPAQTVRVIFVAGQASVQRPDEPAPRPATKGDTVVIGTRIVTGADGRVVLTPMPGVNSIIAPNTTLVLESASENRTSPTNVTHSATLDLKQGAVTTDLDKPEGVTYDYNIRTVRGLAGARGTTFTVGINAAGIQTIVVAHGTIVVNFTDGRQGTLAAGKLSITKPSGESQSVNHVSELSPDDQKIAQNWVETTISALATALEAEIDVDSSALQNALDAAKSLGITLSPEIQALVDRVLTALTVPETNAPEITDAQTVITENDETITSPPPPEKPAGFASIEQFRLSLTETQRAAFDEILIVGGFEEVQPSSLAQVLVESEPPVTSPTAAARQQLTAKLADPAFVKDVIVFIDFYNELLQPQGDPQARFVAPELYVLTNLGILGNGNLAVFGADIAGLKNLLQAYYFIDAPSPNFLYESQFPAGRIDTAPVEGGNFFFPGAYNNSGKTIYNVTFDTVEASTLRVGATRELKIDNTGYEGDAFVAGAVFESINFGLIRTGRVELRAIDLVSLNNTRFSAGVGSILIEANTINLSNISFNFGVNVELNSKEGLKNFGSSKVGYVNFINNVSYGETVLTPTNFNEIAGGYIQIGKIGQQNNR